MKFAVSFIAGASAISTKGPVINLVATSDNSFSELNELTHANLMQGDFNQPDVIRINYESPHANLMENIVRESVSADAPFEEGEIGLNLIPAGSAASLKQLFAKSDAEFETSFISGLHASLIQGPATRIRLPRGGFKEGSSFVSDDGRIAVRVLPARHIPGAFTELASKIESTGDASEAAVAQLLNLFEQGKVSKQQLKDSGAISRCSHIMTSEGASDAMRAGCGSVITHLTNTPVASSIMNQATGGEGHVTVVLPSPSRVYGA
jgi:hypothetical protein